MTRLEMNVTVNGRAFRRRIEPRLLLSDFIRHEIGLTGTHVGCENGVCGACTVLLDGLATRSCCMLAVQADGRRIETVESLGRVNNLNPLQRGVLGKARPAMRLLHAGNADADDRAVARKSQSRPGNHHGFASTTISAAAPAMRTSSARSSARSS